MDFSELTYQQILNIDDINQREMMINLYENEKNELLASYPQYRKRFQNNKTLLENYRLFMEYEENSTSHYLFPGDKINYYPVIKQCRARNIYTSDDTKAFIYPSSEYLKFKAFLYNISKKTAFISRTLKFELSTDFEIPNTLWEFENLCYRLDSYGDNNYSNQEYLQNIEEMTLRRFRKKGV